MPPFPLPREVDDRLRAVGEDVEYADLVADQVEAGEQVYEDALNDVNGSGEHSGQAAEENTGETAKIASVDLAVADESLRKASESVITAGTRKEYEK